MATKPLTPQQLDAVTRFIDEQTHAVFYLAQSASDPDVTYRVTWNKQFSRFSCNCKASSNGLVCWHLRASIEHARHFEAEQERLATYQRVMTAQPTHYSETEIQHDLARYAPRPFSLLR